jgi:ABC-type transport system involved in cytochrome c biogenesis permease subunit
VGRLTKQEQLVICTILGLLLVGWAVKAWRTAHPPTPATTTTAN